MLRQRRQKAQVRQPPTPFKKQQLESLPQEQRLCRDSPAALPQRELPCLHLQEAFPDAPGGASAEFPQPVSPGEQWSIWMSVFPLGCAQAF